jgi:hypothetical protein
MRIVLSGPDGTGKSTIVEGLRRHFGGAGKVQVTWRRFGFVLARALNLAGKIMGLSYYEKTPFGSIGYHRYRGAFAYLYIVVSFVDCLLIIIPKWWVRDRLNRANTQIVDRYLVDIVADLILSTANPRAVLWFFNGILKHHIQNENCILLACAPRIVMERRPDIAYDKSYFHKVRNYVLLRRIYGITEVNTEKATPDASIEKVVSICGL